ncbi:Peptidase M24A, methionine aminopeptidase, subfamily 2, binding site [Metarhizium brunneum]
MGSKTLENEERREHEVPSSSGSRSAGGEPRGSHLSRDGDGCMGSQGADEGDDDDDDDLDESHAAAAVSLTCPTSGEASNETKKKNKKRKRSKKRKAQTALKQSSPPRIPLHRLFYSGEYRPGELCDYQTTSAVKAPELRHHGQRALEDPTFLNNYRKAAEVHRQTRKWVQESVKPGQTLTEIAVGIEDSVRALLDNAGLEPGQGLQSGLGFPTGLSLNHCVAHYTPNPGQKDVVLQHQDVIKVDFGVHVNGWIVDSAFTMSFDPTYDDLLAAVKDATNTGIKNAGIDVRISDVGAAMQEAMESYEVDIRGKTYPVKPVRNLCGHDIKHYRIHGDKTIPFVKNSNQTKMEEGDIFAVETFGSTGRGFIRDGPGIYGYGLSHSPRERVSLPRSSANTLYKTIKENFGTLVFCRRYLNHVGLDRYLAGINYLVSNGILDDYAPLMDVPGSYSAQFEHTILLRESTKEVISRGDDY